MQAFADQLLRVGAVTIPIVEYSSPVARANALKSLDLEVCNFPEFNQEYVQTRHTEPLCTEGTLYALGNAAAFHNEFVRGVRKVAHAYAKDLFRELVKLHGFKERHPDALSFKLEQLIDCLVIQPAGRPVVRQNAWKTKKPKSDTDDVIFGGWVNFSQITQRFSCQLRSHSDSECVVSAADAVSGAGPEAVKCRIDVRPGEMLVFYDDMAHGVGMPSFLRETTKLCTAWRLTTADAPLMGREMLEEVLTTGAVVPLKSRELPAMYKDASSDEDDGSAAFFSNLEAFSIAAIREDLLEEVRVSSCRTWRSIVPQFMPSLQELEQPFKAYDTREKSLYAPMAF